MDPLLSTLPLSGVAALAVGNDVAQDSVSCPPEVVESHVDVVPDVDDAVPTQSYNNLSYAEMIFSAITALNEEDGSSKRAISKFIENTYSGLSESHSPLLTHHLKRLKNSGLLVMNKKSYMLPTRSDAMPVSVGSVNPSDVAANGSYTAPGVYSQPTEMQGNNISDQLQRPDDNMGIASGQVGQSHCLPVQDPSQVGQTPIGSSGVKRGRGRPPKQKNLAQPNDASMVQNPDDEMKEHDATHPVFVALGLVDDPVKIVKRSPGRPKKFLAGEGGVPIVAVPSQQAGVKRGRGRPPKTGAKLSRFMMAKRVAVAGIKRGPGRPPKNLSHAQLQTTLVNVPFSVDPALLNTPKPRGRPRKSAAVAVGGMMPSKHFLQSKRKSTGRPVGRPRKNSAVIPAVANNSASQSDGYEDMKRKLEFFQSKIMEAVNVLKPEFSRESSVNAIAAIQELEGLASMDITKPLPEEAMNLPSRSWKELPPATEIRV